MSAHSALKALSEGNTDLASMILVIQLTADVISLEDAVNHSRNPQEVSSAKSMIRIVLPTLIRNWEKSTLRPFPSARPTKEQQAADPSLQIEARIWDIRLKYPEVKESEPERPTPNHEDSAELKSAELKQAPPNMAPSR